MSGLMNKETAQSQVTHSVLWSEEILINHLLRLNKFILENEFAHFRKRLTSFRIIVIVRSARPKRLLVQLKLLTRGTPENHHP
ncbi:hypothetical protein SDC9_188972 [bioreactor metagenome]|uniref:Uncharacterized protein n=1 Tax=bioreactor metagenome TaxID=1076179 RepID=A0A645HS53_9ZZZZ